MLEILGLILALEKSVLLGAHIPVAFYQALLTCPALSFLSAQVLFQTFSLPLPAYSSWRPLRLCLGIPAYSWMLHSLHIGLHCGI